MDLTTVARVKTLLTGFTTGGEDAFIGLIVSEVSAAFERSLRRKIQTAARTETVELRRSKRMVSLQAAPISAVASIKYASNPADFSTTTALATSNYYVDLTGGFVRFLREMSLDPGFLEITYTAGMAADTAAFIAAFPDLAQAADWQSAEEYTRRRGANRDSFEKIATANFLPLVERALSAYRRLHV